MNIRRAITGISTGLLSTWMAASLMAAGSGSSGELALSAKASWLPDPSSPRVFLSIHVVNTSDHEITVLTRNLNVRLERPTQQMTITLGYADPSVTHDGHAIIPSLYDFSPVTLRPTEEAIVVKELSGMGGLKRITKDTELMVEYTISPEWGRRFSVWHGTVKTGPVAVSVRQPK